MFESDDSEEFEGSWRNLVSPPASGADSDTHSETDYEVKDEAEYEFGDGGGWAPKKKINTKKARTTANGGLPNFKEGAYDKEYWNCSEAGASGSFVRMVDTCNGGEYVVPQARVNKALRYLHQPTIAAALRAGEGKCRCKRTPQCFQRGLSTYAVLVHRTSFFQQLNEYDATKYLADLVRPHNASNANVCSDFDSKGGPVTTPTKGATPTHTKRSRRKFKWILDGVEVCDEFFCSVFGVSKDKLRGVRVLLKNEGAVPAPRVIPERPRVKYNQCKAFWRAFFKNCQRPNNTTRLFPVNVSYPCIYEDWFVPWMQKTLPESINELPCLGWLMSARRDGEFADVKNRPKHHHCRCQECANLQARRLKAFNSPYEQAQFQLEWQDHQNEKRGWREFEEGIVMAARHDPRSYNAYWFDDTEACGLPKWTKRPMKNLPIARFSVIPFLMADLARGKDYYIYTAKGRFSKGANRLCTSLLTTIRATKRSPDESRYARTISLIADNFSENKNNTLLAFACHLVMLGFYDTVQLFYGPPGHTHNGGDQQHQIHNEVLGNFTSPTFVHLLARYPQSWRQEHTRPTPCILDVQYDFDNFYKPFMQKIGGHTNTPTDPVGIRAFKAARGTDGVVGVMWKTKAELGDWKGADGYVGTPGFVVLKGRPRGIPVLIEAKRNIMEKKYYKQLIGTKMTDCLNSEGAPEARQWLAKAAKHGVIPIHARLQEKGDITPGEFGSNVVLRCGEVTAVAQLIEDYDQTATQFWALPADIEAERAQRHVEGQALSKRHRLHPNVGYEKVKGPLRPTWEGSAAQQHQEEKKVCEHMAHCTYLLPVLHKAHTNTHTRTRTDS
jgi:hypothetical protein